MSLYSVSGFDILHEPSWHFSDCCQHHPCTSLYCTIVHISITHSVINISLITIAVVPRAVVAMPFLGYWIMVTMALVFRLHGIS